MDSDSKYKSSLAFTDLLFNVLIGFAFLFIIAFILINPIKKQHNIKSKAEFMAIMEWDKKSKFDIDLWMKDPIGTVVGFPNKDAGWLHLDRDDLGQANDFVNMKSDQTKIIEINREIMTVRGIIPGEYIVNTHFYSAKASPEKSNMDVSIQVIKVNPYQEIYNGIINLKGPSDEKTAIRFKIDDKGDVISKNNLQIKLAGKHLPYANLEHEEIEHTINNQVEGH